jgi:hypothetical protein
VNFLLRTFAIYARFYTFPAPLIPVWRATWDLFAMLWRVSKSHQFRWGLLKIFAIEKKKEQHFSKISPF